MDVNVEFDEPPEPDRKTRQVLGWRREQFERMGFESIVAGILAKRRDVDLHYAQRLLDAGCSHALALEILF